MLEWKQDGHDRDGKAMRGSNIEHDLRMKLMAHLRKEVVASTAASASSVIVSNTVAL